MKELSVGELLLVEGRPCNPKSLTCEQPQMKARFQVSEMKVLRVVRSTTRIPECESMKELSVVDLSLVESGGAS